MVVDGFSPEFVVYPGVVLGVALCPWVAEIDSFDRYAKTQAKLCGAVVNVQLFEAFGCSSF